MAGGKALSTIQSWGGQKLGVEARGGTYILVQLAIGSKELNLGVETSPERLSGAPSATDITGNGNECFRGVYRGGGFKNRAHYKCQRSCDFFYF